MSKRARTWRETNDLLLPPKPKRIRRWPLERNIQPGTIFDVLPPEIRTMMWRMADVEIITNAAFMCYMAYKETKPYQVPLSIVPAIAMPWPAEIRRRCVLDLALAAAHLGIMHVRPRHFYPITRPGRAPSPQPTVVTVTWEDGYFDIRLGITWWPTGGAANDDPMMRVKSEVDLFDGNPYARTPHPHPRQEVIKRLLRQ